MINAVRRASSASAAPLTKPATRVAALTALRQAMRMRAPDQQRTTPKAARCAASGLGSSLTPHPLSYPIKIFRNNVPVASGLEIVFLQGAVFGRARHEGGLQTQLPGGLEVVIVGGDHHHLFRRQAEQPRGPEIGLGVRLVVLG